MMIEHYVQRRLAYFLALILGIFAAFYMVIQLSVEFKWVGHMRYTVWSAMAYVGLTSVSILYLVVPLIVLLATLLAVSSLQRHHELIVVRSSGVSLYGIAWWVLKSIALFAVFVFIVGEVFAPAFSLKATDIKAKMMQNGYPSSTLVKDLWLHEKNCFIHINLVTADRALLGVSRYAIAPNNHVLAYDFAKYAHRVHGKWVFYDVDSLHVARDGFKRTHHKSEEWPIDFSENFIDSAGLDADRISLHLLAKVIKERKNVGMDVSKDALIFWQRVWHPLLLVSMALLALPFAIASPRHGQLAFRGIVGCVLGFVCYFTIRLLSTVAFLFHMDPWAATLLPILLLLALATTGIWYEENKLKYSCVGG